MPKLFCHGDLHSILAARLQAVRRNVYAIHEEQLLATATPIVVEHVVAPLLIEPLVLFEDEMTLETAEAPDDLPQSVPSRLRLAFLIPFRGWTDLWMRQPDFHRKLEPSARIEDSRLRIEFVKPASAYKESYEADLALVLRDIRDAIAAQKRALDKYNESLPGAVQTVVAQRKLDLQKLRELEAELNVPLARQKGMPAFKPIQLPRRESVMLAAIPEHAFQPEPALSASVYEEVLALIRHAGRSFEGAPQTYFPLGEDGLRDTMLSHIAVVFKNGATGETFRKFGKTDIRVVVDARAAFVAECKLWKGRKVVTAAVDQLLGYLTWRDCKVALVFFNKSNANFSAVQAEMGIALRDHPNFRREDKTSEPGELRFSMTGSDPGRLIAVHVFAFDLFVPPERANKRR